MGRIRRASIECFSWQHFSSSRRAWGLGALGQPDSVGEAPESSDPPAAAAGSLALPSNRTVTIVCVTRPRHVLEDLGEALRFTKTAETGIYLSEGLLSCWIVVPSELPLTERYYPLLPLAKGTRLQEFITLCVREKRMEYLSMALDVGLVSDPTQVWIRILEAIGMQAVWTDEVYEIIDKAFRETPDLPWRFPSIRQRFEQRLEEQLEERLNERVEERLNERVEERLNERVEERLNERVEERLNERVEERLDAARGDIAREADSRVRREDLLRLMRHKFGDLPAEAERRVEAVGDVQMLTRWLDQILDADSLDEMGLDQGVP